jgi:hypothetical protein
MWEHFLLISAASYAVKLFDLNVFFSPGFHFCHIRGQFIRPYRPSIRISVRSFAIDALNTQRIS